MVIFRASVSVQSLQASSQVNISSLFSKWYFNFILNISTLYLNFIVKMQKNKTKQNHKNSLMLRKYSVVLISHNYLCS